MASEGNEVSTPNIGDLELGIGEIQGIQGLQHPNLSKNVWEYNRYTNPKPNNRLPN